jgi:hypothetical protein
VRTRQHGEFPSSRDIYKLIATYINSAELLVICMSFNIVCRHYGEQFASILPIWGEFLGADILVVFIIFFNKKC